MKKVGRIIVDADPIVYRAAFASQTTMYEIMFENDDGLLHRIVEGDPRELIKQLERSGWAINQRWSTVVPGDPRLMEMMIDSQLKGIYSHCKEQLKRECLMEVILSGKGNYRDQVATILGYKANRIATPKPHFYKQAKEYVQKSWSAYTVNGREADDEVSIRMRRAAEAGVPAMLATIDKDLDQIPGWHYNYQKHVTYEVTDDDALQLFYAQILCGDSVDNIPGCIGLGPAKSKAIIAACVDAWGISESFIWDAIVAEYATRGVKDYELPEGRDWEDVALEVARLVKLQEYPGQLWSQPGIPDEMVEGNSDD